MFERFTQGARRVVTQAQVEARGLRHEYVGPEHLLLGLAAVRRSAAASVLDSFGLDRERLREAVRHAAGVGPVIEPDRNALETIGIDLDEVRRRTEESFGPGALETTRAARMRTFRGCGHIRFTPRAKRALEIGLREARHLRHRWIGPEHILLGLLHEREGIAARLLLDAGLDLPAVRSQIADELGRESG